MIKRVWSGWTQPQDADEYQRLLDEVIVPGISAREIPGHWSTEILRRVDAGDAEVEFMTVMTFSDWDAVRRFAGGDGRNSVVPEAARRLLARFDEHSAHFDLVANHDRPPPGAGLGAG